MYSPFGPELTVAAQGLSRPKGIATQPYEAMCPVCEQTATVLITHEGMMHGRTERWAEHYVSGENVAVPAP